MGPFDGGFDIVRFGGVRADVIPLSMNRLRARVPSMGAGPVKVSVSTQDGMGNAFDFTVEKPSWQFWE